MWEKEKLLIMSNFIISLNTVDCQDFQFIFLAYGCRKWLTFFITCDWLTLSHIQQNCSRWHRKHPVTNMVPKNESVITKKNWIIVSKGEIWLSQAIFFFCHNVFKSCLLQLHQNVFAIGKGLTLQTRAQNDFKFSF